MQVLLNRKEDLELDKRVDALYVLVSIFTARYQLLRGEIEAPKPVIAMEIVQPKPAPIPAKPKETEPIKVTTEKPAPARKRRAAVLTDEEKSYYLYNACRSFPGEVFRKHINLSLIHKRSTGGLIILRPHQCKKTAATNSQSFLTQVFSNLHESGNHGRVRGKAPAQPFLSRNLPSEAQLQDQTVLTPEIRVIRGREGPMGPFLPRSRQSGVIKQRRRRRRQRSLEPARRLRCWNSLHYRHKTWKSTAIATRMRSRRKGLR